MREPRLSRRRFLVGSAAAGYALAVQPVSAAVVRTPDAGLVAGDVTLPSGGVELRAYRARPQTHGPHPVVLVVHEIFGVHEYIRDVCRRLAHAGYLALAPDLYQRQGDVSALPDLQAIIRDVVSRVPDDQVLADLDASLAWAGAHGGDSDRAAVTGFCWGGRIVWLYAAHQPRLRAGVAWYGRLEAPDAESPVYPLDVAAALRAPVLGLYGGADRGIPLSSVEKMRAALRAAEAASQVVVYPEAPHGFHADYRASFREAAARDGWERLLAWLRKHGAA